MNRKTCMQGWGGLKVRYLIMKFPHAFSRLWWHIGQTSIPGFALVFIVGATLPVSIQAQIVTTNLNTLTCDDLVNTLLGSGVTVPNTTCTGANIALGTFTGGTGATDFASGVILSSGNIADVVGPNMTEGKTTDNGQPGDSDLDTLISDSQTADAAVLEFDFIPSGSTVIFRYVFASEEYNEFVNGTFNDVFGFFVNGVNFALLPDGVTPVSINNVNGGNPAECTDNIDNDGDERTDGADPDCTTAGDNIVGENNQNSQFYINNDCSDPDGGTPCPINIAANGLTVVLELIAPVNAGQVNTMKLAIADAGDSNIDSWVFIEASSIVAGEIFLSPASAINKGGTTHTVTAKVIEAGIPIPDRVVTFQVISGANAGKTGTATTDTNGEASFTYTGDGGRGTDEIQASFVNPETEETVFSNIVTKHWVAVGDVNGNDVLDSDDPKLILDVLVKLVSPDTPPAVNFTAAGDMNADGIINNLDSVLILGVLAELILPPPDNTLITVTNNGDSTGAVTGSAGAVPGGSTVNLTNETSGVTVSVTAAADGSFNAIIPGAVGDRIVIDVNGGPARVAAVVTELLSDGEGIQGMVTASDTGAPVAGLTLQAYNFESGAFITQAVTDESGAYFIEVPAGRYNVVALGTGLLATQWSGNTTTFDTAKPVTVGSITDNVDFALAPGGAISGQVSGPDGTPVAGQLVVFLDTATGDLVAVERTEADGNFSRGLAPGSYKVRIDGEASGLATTYFDHAPTTYAATPVEVTLGETASDKNVQLAQGGRLLGRVTDTAGNPVNDASVTANDTPRGFVDTTRTDENGDYVLSLSPGRYRVRARAAGTELAPQFYKATFYSGTFSGDDSGTFTVVVDAAGDVTGLGVSSAGDVEEITGTLTSGGELNFVVGSTTTGGAFSGTISTAGEISGTWVDMSSGESGTFSGNRVNEALPILHASPPITTTAGVDTPNVDFSLGVGGKISGKVVSAMNGTTLPGVSISASEFSSTGFVDNTHTRFDGTYVLNLPPGDYKLRAIPTGTNFAILAFGDINERNRSTSVHVETGSTTSNIDFHLPIGEVISGRVTSAGVGIPSVEVDFNDLSTGFIRGINSQFDGSYRVALKAPRDYRVSIFTGTPDFFDLARDDRTAPEVSLIPGVEVSNVDFDLSADATLAGRVIAADDVRPLPRASVSAYDAETGTFVASASTDFDGSYKIALPAGSYTLRVNPRGQPLPWQWFESEGTPVYHRSAASVVTVATGEEATANISVASGGSISGRLLSLNDGLPVSAAEVAIFGQMTGAFAQVRVRADGTYTAYGPPDDYQVEVRTSNDTPFAGEFFNDRPDSGSADLVTITGVGTDTPHIDFELAVNF